MAEFVVRRGCGEIGKHARFRAWWAQALEGSSPFSRTPPHRSRPPFHAGAGLSTRAFPRWGALIPPAFPRRGGLYGLSADLAVPVADVRVPLLRFDGRVEADP